jgi:glutamate dehydrogenase
MTDEVGLLVLRDNYLQTQALSLAEAEGAGRLEAYGRMMRSQEKSGRLNRAIEYLPDDETLAERAQGGKGLTRPELAVLLSYAKMALYDELLASDLPDDPALVGDLVGYFPRPLRKRFNDAILRHRLRREIIATVVTNSLVNRTGITFVNDMKEATGLSSDVIARAYLAAREIFELKPLWGAVETLDNKAPTATQYRMLKATGELLDHGTQWLLRNVLAHGAVSVADVTRRFADGVAKLGGGLWSALDPLRSEDFSQRAAALIADGVPNEMARRFAGLDDLTAALDLVRAAEAAKTDVLAVAKIYYALGGRLGFDWLLDTALRVVTRTPWQKRAMGAVIDDLYAQQAELVGRALAWPGGGADGAIGAWLDGHKAGIARVDALLAELKATAQVDLAALTVAGRELRAIIAH